MLGLDWVLMYYKVQCHITTFQQVIASISNLGSLCQFNVCHQYFLQQVQTAVFLAQFYALSCPRVCCFGNNIAP